MNFNEFLQQVLFSIGSHEVTPRQLISWGIVLIVTFLTYQLAIKRRSKIENADIVIPKKKPKEVESEGDSSAIVEDDSAKLENSESDIEENIFSGYGNVIPIRGKESSMDYYLMVLSADVHV